MKQACRLIAQIPLYHFWEHFINLPFGGRAFNIGWHSVEVVSCLFTPPICIACRGTKSRNRRNTRLAKQLANASPHMHAKHFVFDV